LDKVGGAGLEIETANPERFQLEESILDPIGRTEWSSPGGEPLFKSLWLPIVFDSGSLEHPSVCWLIDAGDGRGHERQLDGLWITTCHLRSTVASRDSLSQVVFGLGKEIELVAVAPG
jgi:hypothetical protein